jgi:hypothetical protein
MQNDEIFVNTGSFQIDPVDVKSPSALTQSTWSLTRGSADSEPQRIDSACGRSKWSNIDQKMLKIFV